MNILVLTNCLPAPILEIKARENDVLLTTAELHEKMYPDVHYTFVFVLYTSFFTHLSSKYKEEKEFLDLKSYSHWGRNIEIIAVPSFKWNEKLWNFYVWLAFQRNRSKLQRIIKANKIDIVHAEGVVADMGIAYQLFKNLKIPYVVTVRQRGQVQTFQDRVIKYASNAKRIISLGHADKAYAASLNPNSVVISHGVDDRFLKLKRQFSTQKTLKIITVSRLLEWKNIDKIILALDQIKEGFTFDIYGDGPHGPALEALVAKSSIKDKVTFHGFIDYSLIPETMAKYDIFVLPSYKEHFGRAYIEAMACGLPVISARHTGMDGYIKEGDEGFLVDHTDVNDLRDAIQKFIKDESLKGTMGQKAQAFAKDFSWNAVIAKLDGLYRGILSQN
jgi:glycosyltransferase involved in cell wall biosynthesis